MIVDNPNRQFWLVEVKEGHVFDTKKADGESARTQNRRYFLSALIAIPEIRAEIVELLGTSDAPDN